AEAYRMHSTSVDGMDVVAVEAAAARAADHARSGEGPFLLECRTYRFRAHSMFDAQGSRTREEVEAWKARDPIERLRLWMAGNHQLTQAQAAGIEQDVEQEVAAAAAFAEAGTAEPLEDLERFVLMDHVPQAQGATA
ncbi:thiamine pyrophosphate-dependent enzyme, partial [Ramlibacter sp.]